ncbi:MAG: hypothetical protein ACRDRH_20345 [Pseudonocardia sp.]
MVDVTWRPLALRLLNEPIGYENRPSDYPHAHQRGLEMLRVVDAAREQYGTEVVGAPYTAMGEEIWNSDPPAEATFEAVLAEEARSCDLGAVLERVGLPGDLAKAAADTDRDLALREETFIAVDGVDGDVGKPILWFDPPRGPALFGPVIDEVVTGDEARRLWDAVVTLAHVPGFAELKRTLSSFPHTPLNSRIAGEPTRVR